MTATGYHSFSFLILQGHNYYTFGSEKSNYYDYNLETVTSLPAVRKYLLMAMHKGQVQDTIRDYSFIPSNL